MTAPGPREGWHKPAPRSTRKKILIGLVVLLGALALVLPLVADFWYGFSNASSTTAPSASPAYTSEEGRYSASFPGQPTHSDQQYDFWESPDGSVLLDVGWSDYPVGYASTHDLDAAYDQRLQQLVRRSVTVTASHDISVQGHPGREVTLDGDGVPPNTARILFVGDRLYIALAIAPTEAERIAFLDSFSLLDPPPASSPRQAPSVPPASTWTTYPSVAGGYSAIFPGLTQHHSTAYQTDPVLTGETDEWGSLRDGLAFLVRWIDFPTGYKANHDLQGIYDYTQSQTLAINEATLVGSREISVNGYTGREFEVSSNAGHATTRVCVVGDRYYTWGTFFATPEDTQAFLDSFRTLNP